MAQRASLPPRGTPALPPRGGGKSGDCSALERSLLVADPDVLEEVPGVELVVRAEGVGVDALHPLARGPQALRVQQDGRRRLLAHQVLELGVRLLALALVQGGSRLR